MWGVLFYLGHRTSLIHVCRTRLLDSLSVEFSRVLDVEQHRQRFIKSLRHRAI